MALTLAPPLMSTPPAAQATAAIELHGVSHTYQARSGRSPALHAVDLRVATGELVALVGPSGCGKSTLLRIVAGLLESSGGSVEVGGLPPRDARRRFGLGW